MKIFVDTAPFIYLIEEYPKYAKRLKEYFTELYVNEQEVITSVITYSEYGVNPQKKDQPELIEKFENFLNRAGIALLEVNKSHAKKAYQLRAKYEFLKGMDSIQLGTAMIESCDRFLSNDAKLKKVTEVEVILIDSLLKT